MGEHSEISWTHATFNPWRGCTRVSPGCANCYAAREAGRFPDMRGIWGNNGTRIVAAESMWREPLKWNRKAELSGERRRVFCASLADVFEDWQGAMMDAQGRTLHYNSAATWWVPEKTMHGPIPMRFVRERLFDLICRTPHLDWLVLTKRPENALRMMVEAGLYAAANPNLPCPQPNLWIGTSVEDQERADERIPHLLKVPAVIRFLSCEPLLGPTDLRLTEWQQDGPDESPYNMLTTAGQGINWCICGGESGPHARPMNPQWARDLRDQCVEAGVAFFHKQNGEFVSVSEVEGPGEHYVFPDGRTVRRTGKKLAGRMLDGREWSEFPSVSSESTA